MTREEQDKSGFADFADGSDEKKDDDGGFDSPNADIPTAVGKQPLVPQPIVSLDLPFSDDDFEEEVITHVAVPVAAPVVVEDFDEEVITQVAVPVAKK